MCMRAYLFNIALIITFIYSPLYSQAYLPPELFSIENGLSSEYVTSLEVDNKDIYGLAQNMD